jgi:serine/threonine protein phosphatase 1
MIFNPLGWRLPLPFAEWRHKSSSDKKHAPAAVKYCGTGSASLPPSVRIYAVGDIHGMSALLLGMLNVICADAAQAEREAERTIIVLCGDYVDRGPDSAGVLSILSALSLSGIELVALRGNHEDMLQRFMEQPERFGAQWIANGGDQTLRSYEIPTPEGSPQSLREAQQAMARRMPMSHFTFLVDLKSSFSLGDYFFCHAGARPSIPLTQQNERDLLWIGKEFISADHGFEKVIVHGHHAAAEPLIAKHRISVDTGAYATGRLTAAVLENTSCRFLEAPR